MLSSSHIENSPPFRYITFMLDLAFVRDHLDKVEEALRNRGMNPEVVLKDFREIDSRRRQAITQAEALKAHVEAQLARFKVPREIVFVTELPRTALGKVQHFRLKQMAEDNLRSAGGAQA